VGAAKILEVSLQYVIVGTVRSLCSQLEEAVCIVGSECIVDINEVAVKHHLFYNNPTTIIIRIKPSKLRC
jgi:hypothetical protein